MTGSPYHFAGSEDFTPEEAAQAAQRGVVYMPPSELDEPEDLRREVMAAIVAPYLAKPTGNTLAPLLKPF